MLTLSGPGLPTTATPQQTAGVRLTTIDSSPGAAPPTGVPLTEAVTFVTSTLATPQPATVTTAEANSATIAIPSTAGNVSAITIGGITYTPAVDAESSTPGTFTYNPQASAATVYSSAPPAADSTAKVVTIAEAYPVVQQPRIIRNLPALLKTWNISGAITISRSFEGTPSGNAEFVAQSGDIDAICRAFRTGTPLTINGVGLAVGGLSYTDTPHGEAAVSIELVSVHEAALDALIKYRETRNTTSITMAALCSKGGTKYHGPAIEIPIEADAPLRAATTIDDELQRSRSVGGFAYYDHPTRIEIREWDATTLHSITNAEIMNGSQNPISVSFGGDGEVFQNKQLAEEYRNRELTLDTDGLDEDNPDGGRDRNTRVELRKVSGEFRKESLADPSAAFDLGGRTQVITRTQYLNQQPTAALEETFGYAFASSQTYGLRTNQDGDYEAYYNGQFSSYWRLVKSVLKEYRYDNDGYLTSIYTRTDELRRFLQESSAREAINLKFEIQSGKATGDDALVKQQMIDLYEGYGSFIEESIETFELESHGRYYPDIEVGEGDVAPKFVKARKKEIESYAETPDPRNQTREPGDPPLPPLTMGHARSERIDTTILYPGLGAGPGWNQGKEKYLVDEEIVNRDGQALKNTAVQSSSTDNFGRPGVQTRVELYDSVYSVGSGPSADGNSRILLRSPNTGLADDDPIEGSISFPGAFTVETALAAAALDLSIANSQSVEVHQVSLRPTFNYQVGDRISWKGKRFRVFGLSSTYEVLPGYLSLTAVDATLGVELEVPVEDSRVARD